MAQRPFSAAVRAFGQSPARFSHKSGSPVSAPCSSISRARVTRPCRLQRWHLISSRSSLPCSSLREIDPRLLIRESQNRRQPHQTRSRTAFHNHTSMRVSEYRVVPYPEGAIVVNAGGHSRIEETTPHNGDVNALAIFFYESNITHCQRLRLRAPLATARLS